MAEYPEHVGMLDAPRSRHQLFIHRTGCTWAGDNGAYSADGFRLEWYHRMLRGAKSNRERCLFIVAPDTVGDADATLAQFREWEPELHRADWPVAFVSQDGLTSAMIPWDSLECFFVGGTDAWKLSQPSVALMRQAKERRKWLHVGRVNTRKRVMFCHHVGADSFDGTTFAIHPDGAARWILPMLRSLSVQPELFRVSGEDWRMR
jgi:hypothetical protein